MGVEEASDSPVDVLQMNALLYFVIRPQSESQHDVNGTDEPGGQPFRAIAKNLRREWWMDESARTPSLSHRGAAQGTENPGARMHLGERGRSGVMGHQVKDGRKWVKDAHVIPESLEALREPGITRRDRQNEAQMYDWCWSGCLLRERIQLRAECDCLS